MSPHSPKVSLPSINELFPEHLLAAPPSLTHRYSPPVSPASLGSHYPTEPTLSYPYTATRTVARNRAGSSSSSDPRHSPASYDEYARPRTLQIYPMPTSMASSAGAHSSARCTDPCCDPNGRTGREPAAYPNNATQVQVAAPYSFDVLRQNPLTANLENVASSTSASEPPRIPNATAFAYGATGVDPIMASITKARPAFRVQLGSPIQHPMSVNSAPTPSFGRLEDADERKLVTFPPSFSANAYLSAPTTPGSAQSLQRQFQQQPEVAPGSEDKRHCCPHCNKRFNRPSSLNIHVNTHTGAKPFVCRFPGCNRKFNVNSNMRRHYRNHLTTRRRDAVARMLQSTSPSPSNSASPVRSPEPGYAPHPPYAQPQYMSRSPDHQMSSYSDPEEYDRLAYAYSRRPSSDEVKRETPEPIGVPESSMRDDRCRLRSNSSPVPRYRGERVRRQEGSCGVPGCPCVPAPISTALRPAFADYRPSMPRNAAERSRP